MIELAMIELAMMESARFPGIAHCFALQAIGMQWRDVGANSRGQWFRCREITGLPGVAGCRLRDLGMWGYWSG